MGGGRNATSAPALPSREAPAPESAPTEVRELAALRDAFEELRTLLERLGGPPSHPQYGPMLVSPDGRIEYVSPWFEQLFGIPPAALLGASIADVTAWLGLRTVEPEAEGTATCTVLRPNGTERLLDQRTVPLVGADGRFLGTLRSFHDATAALRYSRELAEKNRELDEARAHLTRAQHLKALGQLAAEVAHEFGNLLQAIGLQAAALRHQPALPESVTRSVSSIKQAVDMGQALTRRLLTFARDDPQ